MEVQFNLNEYLFLQFIAIFFLNPTYPRLFEICMTSRCAPPHHYFCNLGAIVMKPGTIIMQGITYRNALLFLQNIINFAGISTFYV